MRRQKNKPPVRTKNTNSTEKRNSYFDILARILPILVSILAIFIAWWQLGNANRTLFAANRAWIAPFDLFLLKELDENEPVVYFKLIYKNIGTTPATVDQIRFEQEAALFPAGLPTGEFNLAELVIAEHDVCIRVEAEPSVNSVVYHDVNIYINTKQESLMSIN